MRGAKRGRLGCCILWFDTARRGLWAGSPRTGGGHLGGRLDVDDEERFLVSGIRRQQLAAGGEGGGAAGDAVGPLGALVELGAGVLGVQVEREHPQPFGQVLGAAFEGVAPVEVEDLVP